MTSEWAKFFLNGNINKYRMCYSPRCGYQVFSAFLPIIKKEDEELYSTFLLLSVILYSKLLPFRVVCFFLIACGSLIKMKSYIWLQTADGSIQQVEEEVAMFCPMICREVLQTGMGSSKNYAISLPQRVNPAILGLILEYCQFHQVPGRSNKVSFWFPFYNNAVPS